MLEPSPQAVLAAVRGVPRDVWCFAGDGAPFWGLLTADVIPATDWRA